MKLILFTKCFPGLAAGELVARAAAAGVAGLDLAVRPGYAVHPDNVAAALPELVRRAADAGLSVDLISAPGDLTDPEAPAASRLVRAMGAAGIARLKPGYFVWQPPRAPYAATLAHTRRLLAGWERLCADHGVTLCLHTHCGPCLGLNGSALAHLLEPFAPGTLAAYIDPAHLLVDGEPFDFALATIRERLAMVALKDVLITRAAVAGHGRPHLHWCEAGQGMVDWSLVFAELRAAGYDGPLSVHAEFEVEPERFAATLAAEVRFFQRCAAGP